MKNPILSVYTHEIWSDRNGNFLFPMGAKLKDQGVSVSTKACFATIHAVYFQFELAIADFADVFDSQAKGFDFSRVHRAKGYRNYF